MCPPRRRRRMQLRARARRPHALAITPDARTIYALAYGSDSIVVLIRDRRTGALWQIAGRNGCIAGGNRRENDTLNCAVGRALETPWTLKLSPDGRNLYVLSDNGIAVFAPTH